MKLNQICMAAAVVAMTAQAAEAQENFANAPKLVTAVVQEAPVMSQQNQGVHLKFDDSVRQDLPASITQPSGILRLAPAGIQGLPVLPTRGHGCNLCPDVRCHGPVYPGCSPFIYYGTNPRDDDPVLPLYPHINDAKTKHWYDAALRMVRRKKAVAEVIK